LRNQNTLERAGTKATVIALILEGKTDTDIATAVSSRGHVLSRQAVTSFRKRHAGELASAVQAVEQAIVNVAIKDKEERIRKLARIYERCEEFVEQNGVMVTEVEYRNDGETTIETRRFQTGLVREMRGILKDVAEELGQIPRADTAAVAVAVQVIVREVHGSGQRELG